MIKEVVFGFTHFQDFSGGSWMHNRVSSSLEAAGEQGSKDSMEIYPLRPSRLSHVRVSAQLTGGFESQTG